MLSGDLPAGAHLNPETSLTVDGVATPGTVDWTFTRDLALRIPGVDDMAPAAGTGQVTVPPPRAGVNGGPSPWRTGEDRSPTSGSSATLVLALSPDHSWPVASCRVDAPEGSMWNGSVGVKLIDPIDTLSVPLNWPPLHTKMPPLSAGASFRYINLCNAYVIDRALRDAGWSSTPPASPNASLHVPMVGSLYPRVGWLEAADWPPPTATYRESMPQNVVLVGAGQLNTWRVNNTGIGNFECSMEVDTSTVDPGAVHWWIIDGQGAGSGYRLHYSHSNRAFFVSRAQRDSSGNLTAGTALVSVTLPEGEHRVSVRIRRYQNATNDLPEVAVRLKGTPGEWTSTTLAGSYPMSETNFWRVYLTTTGAAVAGAFLIDDPTVPWATLAHEPSVRLGFTWSSIASLQATPRFTADRTALELVRDFARAEYAAWGFDEDGRVFYRTRVHLATRPLVRTFTSADLVDFSWTDDMTAMRSSVTITRKVPARIARRYPTCTVWQGSGDALDPGEEGSVVMSPDADEDWLKVDAPPDGSIATLALPDVAGWNAGIGSWMGGARVLASGDDTWPYGAPGSYLSLSSTQIDATTWSVDYTVAANVPAGESIELRSPELSQSAMTRRKGAGLPILRAFGVTRWLDRDDTQAAGPASAPRLEHDVGWMVQDGNARQALMDWLVDHVSTNRPRLSGVRIKPDPRVQVGDRVRVVDDRADGTGVDVTGLVVRKQLSGSPGRVDMVIDVVEV